MNTAHRVLTILKCFSPDEKELGPSDVAKKIQVHRSTAHRISRALSEDGFLEKNVVTGKYQIGPELYKLGSLYLETTDLTKAASPAIKALNELTGEVTNLAIMDKGYVTLIMREESKYEFRWSRHIGSTVPAHASAMGKALLSELTSAEIDRLFPQETLEKVTPKTIATRKELKTEREEIRKNGISIDREGSAEGVIGIASVIRDASGKAVAAMSIALPVFRMSDGLHSRLIQLVKMGASLISYRLGYPNSDTPIRDIKDIQSWWEQNETD